MSKQYTERDMLILYATIDQYAHIHADFPNYRRKLVEKLQELFDVNLSIPSQNTALFYLFQSTIETYQQATSHPLSGYLDATGIYVTLREKTGDKGIAVYEMLDAIGKTCETKQQQYHQLLYDLYDLIWQAQGKVITDDDLMKAGFDTSKEPKWIDYM